MREDDMLKVSIGDSPLACRTPEDAAILEPVGGILIDNSIEGYTTEQVEQMAATLAGYDRPEELQSLKRLLEARKRS